MPPDDLERLHELREDADRHAQLAQNAVPAQTSRSGTDPSGKVWVRVDAQGILRAVHVAMDWQQHVQPEQLSAAITAAIASLAAASMAEWSQQIEDLQLKPPPPARPLPLWTDDGADTFVGDSANHAERLSRLAEVIDEITSKLDEAIADSERALTYSESVRSPRGEVTVEVGANGSIRTLDLSPRWLETAHPTNIGRLVAQTVSEAQRRSVAAFADFKVRAEDTKASVGKFQDSRIVAERIGFH